MDDDVVAVVVVVMEAVSFVAIARKTMMKIIVVSNDGQKKARVAR